MTRYLTTRQFALRTGKAHPTVKKYVKRIAGARKIGRDWFIPEGAPWPTSGRPGRPKKQEVPQ